MDSTGSFETIDPSLKVEEETVPSYKAHKFYPVRIGETIHERYRVLGKLGYGSGSTIWLCRDLSCVLCCT